MGLREFVSDPRFQSKDEATKRAMLADYGVEEADFGPLLGFKSIDPGPDPRGMMASGGVGARAGAQVLAPINAQAALDNLADAGRIYQAFPAEIPGVVADYAQGALKGLGRMAAPLVNAVGLGSDYSDAALAPENGVESVGGTGAQIGATTLATAALGGPMIAGAVRLGVPAAVVSPVGLGTTAAVGTKAVGGSNWDAAQNALMAASFGKVGAKPIPAGKGAIKPLPAPKPTSAQIKAAIESGPRGNAAKQAMRAEREAAKAVEAPKPAPTAPNPPAKPSSVAETARDVDSALKSLDKASQARLKHVVKKAESKLSEAPKPKPEAPSPKPEIKGGVDDRTDIAKYYNLHPERSLAQDAVDIHPTLGLPMNAQGKVMIRTLEGNTTWHTPEYAQNMADILKARAKAPTSLEDVAARFKAGVEASKRQPIVDRMKVPKVVDNLAREQREGLADAIKKFGPDKAKGGAGGDVVYAPPAFKGQQSGGTRARFEHQAKRQAKLREDAIKADAQKRANEIGMKVRELKQSGKTPAEIRETIASETGFDADSVSQLVNIALKGSN